MNLDLKGAAVAVLAVALLGVSVAFGITDKRLDEARTANSVLTAQAEANATVLQAISDTAKVREDASKAALQAAVEAGKANRAASTTYLALPAPAPELRCDAAQELIEQARKEAR